jgi:glycosyltransferase involved in cell wall biosynthesis
MIIANFHPTSGGSEISAKRLSNKLRTAFGWPVKVLTRRSIHQGEPLPNREEIDGLPVVRINTPHTFSALPFMIGALVFLFLNGRGGIYHAHDVHSSNWIAVIASYIFRGYSIIKLRTGRSRYEQRLASNLRWHLLTPIRLADRIIVVNKEVEEWLYEIGIPKKRVKLIPNGVETSIFQPATSRQKINARIHLNLPDNKVIFLYTGRLNAIKGADILLRAWSKLSEQLAEMPLLVLVGKDSRKNEVLELISNLNIKDSTILIEQQEDILSYYWATDGFLLPSRVEGLSNSLLEAMSCGLPVIASNTGGALDIVEEGENGFLFESENWNDLAEKILFFLGKPKRWKIMGDYGRQTVKEYADLSECAQHMSDLYHQL